MADIEKAGLLTLRENRMLLCRKGRDTGRLILPGGRIEPGEGEVACLLREIGEELGAVNVSQLQYVGSYEDVAHFDDPTIRKSLRIVLYKGILDGDPTPHSEIAELVWFGPQDDPSQLTPIFTRCILPDLKSRDILNW